MIDDPLGPASLSPFFAASSPIADPEGERLIPFDDVHQMFLVVSGAVDLFAVRSVDGAMRGRWTFLNRIEQGSILVGSPPGPRHRIVGRPVLGSVVHSMSISHLETLGVGGRHLHSDPDHQRAIDQFISGVEQGLVALGSALRTALPPREFVPLTASGRTELEDGQSLRSVDGVQWILIEEGAIEMADGIAGRISVGTDVCFTERDWLVAHGRTRLRARSARELLAEGELWSAWITHSARLLFAIDRRLERRGTAERELIELRRGRDHRTMQEVVRTFETVLLDNDTRIRLADVASDAPTLAAARVVADREGFRVRAPIAGSVLGRAVTELQSIALASKFKTRNVRLDTDWWKKDLGAMVGYRKIRDAPVALLPIEGGYVLAEGGQVTRVNSKVADGLRNIGTTLYRPLPQTVQSVSGLIRFGLGNSRRDISRFAGTGLLVSVIGLLVPIMTGIVLGTFVAHAQRDLIIQGSLVVVASAFVVAVLSIVQNIAALRVEGRSSAVMQAGVWTKLLSLPASFFARRSAGELGTTVLGVSAAQETISGLATTATLGLFTGLANLVLVYFLDLRLALIATALVGAGAIFAVVAGASEVRWQRRLYAYEKRMSSRVFQILSAVPKLRVAAAEERVFGLWAAEFAKGRRLRSAARRAQNAVTTFNSAFPLIASAIIFVIVGGPLHDSVSIGTFLSFFVAFNLLLASSLQFTATAITALGVVPMLGELEPILVAEPEMNDVQTDPGELSGQVALTHVSFRYSKEGPLVLDDVTISIQPGEFVALVGPSGSGKSTVLRLLLGFESPTSGSVLFDNQALAELEISAVRRQCGVVLQKGALLAASIKTNILGSGDYTLDDAWSAATMAGIADDIKALPMGMNTVLSEGTSTFSGGQRQRLMIARALVSRPRILLLDEATSALDNPTQRIVADATRKLNASRLVIAHRLSTVTEADKIVVLDKGRVVQQGRYAELLADEGGLFATLARRQM